MEMIYGRSPAMDVLPMQRDIIAELKDRVAFMHWCSLHVDGWRHDYRIFGFIWKTTIYHRYT